MRRDPGEYEIPGEDTARPFTQSERAGRYRKRKKPPIQVGILDLETDPFDNETLGEIYPFLAVLYLGPEREPVVIWDENWQRLMQQVHDVINQLPGRFIIYAHNGGRFDYLFLLRELRGEVLFKGRALMSAKIGAHEIRDSLHIIPETLKNANRKTEIDYKLFKKGKRDAHRREITDYCIDDCVSLYEVVTAFRDEFGTPLTIGQAAMRAIKKSYSFDRLTETSDLYFRQWFFGGRVECLQPGVYDPIGLRLYDVNSMYPFVMAKYSHPISANFSVFDTIRANTIFLTIRAQNNGALVSRGEDGSLSTQIKHGIFNTTIWEYEVALKHGLIRDVEVVKTIEFERSTDFANFVIPLYEGRQRSKELQREAIRSGDIVAERNHSRDVLFRKLLMNNGYGKFAQNPRRFKVHMITDTRERPGDEEEWGTLPEIETDAYWVWSKPTDDLRFNNVCTAASITGAARAVLLDALAGSVSPVYCDTDSIICRDIGDVDTDAFRLGAWDIEAKIDAFIGNGKKLYAYRIPDREPPKNIVVKAKGMNGVTWEDMLRIANGDKITKTMRAPTLQRDGSQEYMRRILRQTITQPSLII